MEYIIWYLDEHGDQQKAISPSNILANAISDLQNRGMVIRFVQQVKK